MKKAGDGKNKRENWANPQEEPYALRKVNQTKIISFQQLPDFIRQEYQTEGRPSPEEYVVVKRWSGIESIESAWQGLLGRALTTKERGDLTKLSKAQLRRLKRFIYSHQHTKPNSNRAKVFVRFSLDETPVQQVSGTTPLQSLVRLQIAVSRILNADRVPSISLRISGSGFYARCKGNIYNFYGFSDRNKRDTKSVDYNRVIQAIINDLKSKKITEETALLYATGLMGRAALAHATSTGSDVVSLVFVNPNNQDVQRREIRRSVLELAQQPPALQHSMQHYTGRDGSRRTIQSIPTKLLLTQPIPVALLPELTRPGKRIKRLPRRLPELK